MRSGPEILRPARNSRSALMRAGIAGVLLVILLVIVLSGGQEEQTEPPVAPAVEAPLAAVEPPQPVIRPSLFEPIPVEPASESAIAAPEVTAEQPVEPAPEQASPQPEPAPAAPETPVTPPPAKPAPAPKPAPAVRAAPTPASASHMVQLADFGPLPVAKGQLHATAPLGYAGRVMHRVLIGPFATRDAARAAMQAGAKGLLVQADADWWVQAGVFSDAGNAERLRASLAGAGRQVVVHGRAEMGPFANRGDAEKALAEARAAVGEPLKEAVIVTVR